MIVVFFFSCFLTIVMMDGARETEKTCINSKARHSKSIITFSTFANSALHRKQFHNNPKHHHEILRKCFACDLAEKFAQSKNLLTLVNNKEKIANLRLKVIWSWDNFRKSAKYQSLKSLLLEQKCEFIENSKVEKKKLVKDNKDDI